MTFKSVTLQNVTKTFEDQNKKSVHAVADVNLTIKEGEFATLLGPSGCGKTTMLRMIAGFEEITEGTILFGEDPVNDLPPNKRDCTMVFQSYALFPHLNVFDNVAYGLKLKKMSKTEIASKVDEVLNVMNLGEHTFRMPNQLSGGQQQRVALARALVMEPSVLLFDEPLSNLDAKLRLLMRDEIRRIQKMIGITAIYVTHDQGEALSMSDKIIVMNKGHVEQIGTAQEIYQKPRTKFVADFIGTATFLEGTVISLQGDTFQVKTEASIFSTKSIEGAAVGDVVSIVLRPESIRFTERSAHVASVTKSVFMGQYQEYEVDFGGQLLQITVMDPLSHKIYEVGNMAYLEFPEESLHVVKL
ncbi:ABC transporter ATP-binding protein [Paenibacillus sp. GSMTC-2017]|uniref:ABC transporter ATP-binding protein n=1 Tax=Paenibacillus sp. GSMTC-2017 TaxID=2794350 RepID=UPI0018D96A7B|nr:ABC transporter ATP-binding protein [Paenibacillus sp. GSMTC-2017]MBH5320699.1 ABC transporter ATP-binding protein [Paenibacillus sp. GSMTC-2017]